MARYITSLTSLGTGNIHNTLGIYDDINKVVSGVISAFNDQPTAVMTHMGGGNVFIATTTLFRITNVLTGIVVSSGTLTTSMTPVALYDNDLYFRYTNSDKKIYKVSSTGVITTAYDATPLAGNINTTISNGRYLVIVSTTGVYASVDLSAGTLLFQVTVASATLNLVLNNGNFVTTVGATSSVQSISGAQAIPNVSFTNSFAICKAVGNFTYYYNSTTIRKIDNTSFVSTQVASGLSLTGIYLSPDPVFLTQTATAGVLARGFFNLVTETQVLTELLVISGALDAQPLSFKHPVIINETLAATNFKVQAFDFETRLLVREQTMSGTGGDLFLPSDRQVQVVINPDIGQQFKTLTAYSLGTKIYPKNTAQFPYYFECTTAGTSGIVEPAFNTSPGGTTASGTAVFTVIEQIPNSSAKPAILPIPV